MPLGPRLAFVVGAALVAVIGYGASLMTAPALAARLHAESTRAIEGTGNRGVSARFISAVGLPTRHPILIGGKNLNNTQRAEVARAVAAVPGVGGVFWADKTGQSEPGKRTYEPLHCQDDVDGLLRTRSVRFQEASSALHPASQILLDEVADALRPCLGAIIAITGHTDTSGNEPGNLALSMDRARAVREALVQRGIPRDGLRARGVGSAEPVKGLAPNDPANRRIEFSVIRTEPLRPTPVDTPGAN